MRLRGSIGLLSLALLAAAPASAQQPAPAREPTAWSRIGGGALGAASVGTLTTVAALIPCNRTSAGPVCVRPPAVLGGIVGLGAGIASGAAPDLVEGAAGDAAAGALVGGAMLLVLQPFLERWSWGDVAGGALIGGAVAAAGPASAIGFGLGVGTGVILMYALPDFGPTDAASTALVGLAAGGVAGWISRALDARDGGGADVFRASVGWSGP